MESEVKYSFCPLALAVVDQFDQLREQYAVGRRSWKWWHTLAIFVSCRFGSCQCLHYVEVTEERKRPANI